MGLFGIGIGIGIGIAIAIGSNTDPNFSKVRSLEWVTFSLHSQQKQNTFSTICLDALYCRIEFALIGAANIHGRMVERHCACRLRWSGHRCARVLRRMPWNGANWLGEHSHRQNLRNSTGLSFFCSSSFFLSFSLFPFPLVTYLLGCHFELWY